MTADDLKRLERIVTNSENPRHVWFQDTEVSFLLELLTNVARTAGKHFDSDSFYQDGEIDAIAILDTITGENHIRQGKSVICERCNGDGVVQEFDRDYRPVYTENPCKACNGTGMTITVSE